jgi:diguanylate cyclase (GGDEF)-like protein
MSLSAIAARFGMLSSRLARRLFGLFLLASLVPLSISAWVSTSAISQVAEDLNQAERQDATRRASKMVLDRLLSAASVLESITSAAAATELAAVGRGQDQRVAVLSRTARQSVRPNDAGELEVLWRTAKPAPLRSGVAPPRVELRTAFDEAGMPHVLLGTHREGAVVWLAEVERDFLWEPLENASEDSSWDVKDGDGRTLRTRRGGDADPNSRRVHETLAQLFLLDLFGAKDWRFEQTSPKVTALWHGQSLTRWLTLVAVSTLLAAAGLIHWQIRRTLAPLQALTSGTRSLAAGETGTRVAVEREDEIGMLAASFNEMAGNLEGQFEAMRAVAEIDRGVIGGASLHRLAEVASRRLALAYPDGHTIRWRNEDGRIATESGGPPGEHLKAGLTRIELPIEIESVEFGMLTVTVALAHSGEVLRPARELRDRLTVAFAARAREQQLVYRAHHDSLTGLLNRYGLNVRLEELLTDPTDDRAVSLLLLDLDHFKEVNDSMGHAAGDELLCLVADRLRAVFPGDVLIGRQGGDEFAVIFVGSNAGAVRESATRALDVLSTKFSLRSVECALGASIGITHRTPACRIGNELLRQADLAMYAAKAQGRGRCLEFSSELNASAENRVQLIAELRDAVQRDEFVVHYQPRVEAASGRIASAEALVRWQHPAKGLVYPDTFIPVAELAGLIGRIGETVLDRACSQIAAWRAIGLGIRRVSVNISPLQLVTGDLPQIVRTCLASHDLPADALELEVTESALVGDVTSAHRQLAELRAMGITIALDDFGTGYSSLSSLRMLPIDVLKIDRSFVQDIQNDAGAMAVTRSIVALAKSLGMRLVAEGVETAGQAALLAGLGCEELQGYLYARPQPPEDFIAHFMQSNQEAPAPLLQV